MSIEAMNYTENVHGIRYSAKRGDVLEIHADAEEFYLSCWNGVLNLMSRSLCGRTAVFVADCDFYQGVTEIVLKVQPGTPSYMKELSRVRKVSREEAAMHSLGRLW